MYAAVVYDIGFHHLPAVGFLNFGNAEAEQIVADMAEVQRFIGVGRRIFNHHQVGICFGCYDSEFRLMMHFVKLAEPVSRSNGEIDKSLDNVVFLDTFESGLQKSADFFTRLFGRFAGKFYKRENHQGYIAFKFFLCFLKLNDIR